MKTMSANAARVRRSICRQCVEKCAAFRLGRIDHDEPSAACPLTPPRWGRYASDVTLGRAPASSLSGKPTVRLRTGKAGRWAKWCAHARGLGDYVELLAKPIAHVLDLWFGTKLGGCSACNKRKRWLNTAPTRLRAWLKSLLARLKRGKKVLETPPATPRNG